MNLADIANRDAVNEAFNRAIDDILAATGVKDDSAIRSAMDLVVDAGLYYLTTGTRDLGAAIKDAHNTDPATVLGWISGG